MTKRPRIGVVGSSNVDLVTYVERMPVWGETISAPRFEMSHGGKGANQAVAAAKLGASVVMVSKVGDDMLGEGVLKNFEAVGVDAAHVRRVPGQSTGTATILVNAAGDNFILIVKGANGDLTPADVEAAGEDLAACDLILLQLEVPLETVYAALAFGKRHGVKTALNPAPAVRNLDMEHVRLASFLTPNETELAILTGMPVGSEDEIAAAAKSLLAQGLETVIVTLGARGSLLATAAGPEADRAGQGAGGRLDRRRRRLHRRVRPLFRRRSPARGGARPGDPLRRRFGHEARRAEVLRHGGRVRGFARQARRPGLRRSRRVPQPARPKSARATRRLSCDPAAPAGKPAGGNAGFPCFFRNRDFEYPVPANNYPVPRRTAYSHAKHWNPG